MASTPSPCLHSTSFHAHSRHKRAASLLLYNRALRDTVPTPGKYACHRVFGGSQYIRTGAGHKAWASDCVGAPTSGKCPCTRAPPTVLNAGELAEALEGAPDALDDEELVAAAARRNFTYCSR